MKFMNEVFKALDFSESVEVFCPVCGTRSEILGVEESILIDSCPVCNFEVVFESSRRLVCES
jgi:uncharacterized Zn finger protein (UPF0148 family)